METRQRPVLYDGRVTGQGTATVEFDYEVMLDSCSNLDFYGEPDWTEDDMISYIEEQLQDAVSRAIEDQLDALGYQSYTEPSISSAHDVVLSSTDIDYLEIEFEDVEDDDDESA